MYAEIAQHPSQNQQRQHEVDFRRRSQYLRISSWRRLYSFHHLRELRLIPYCRYTISVRCLRSSWSCSLQSQLGERQIYHAWKIVFCELTKWRYLTRPKDSTGEPLIMNTNWNAPPPSCPLVPKSYASPK